MPRFHQVCFDTGHMLDVLLQLAIKLVGLAAEPFDLAPRFLFPPHTAHARPVSCLCTLNLIRFASLPRFAFASPDLRCLTMDAALGRCRLQLARRGAQLGGLGLVALLRHKDVVQGKRPECRKVGRAAGWGAHTNRADQATPLSAFSRLQSSPGKGLTQT